MTNNTLFTELLKIADCINSWDGEDICQIYALLIKAQSLKNQLELSDDIFSSVGIKPYNLPVGNSTVPKNIKYVWTWDNHGRYLIGSKWTETDLRIRTLEELELNY